MPNTPEDKILSATSFPNVTVSGIQPSGTLHLGNYFGAIRQHIEWQTFGDSFYFIVNYHALTSLNDAKALEGYSLDVARDYLALGFTPSDTAHLFLQSDVPQVTELSWIFNTITPVSQLEKGVAFKDKVAQGLSANAGLFNYPILQAADILVYGGTLVPVGADQKQNLEICRDLASRFNERFSPEDPIFPIPLPLIKDDVAVVPGTDGRKMSKSYGNTIGIFDEGKELKKKVMSIVTDSTPLEEPKDPDTCNVFALIRLFANENKREEVAAAYRAGGYGYGHAKTELLTLITEYFAEARERRKDLKTDDVMDVLRTGGIKGRERAEQFMEKVRLATGLITTY